jgi:hypothetical protein
VDTGVGVVEDVVEGVVEDVGVAVAIVDCGCENGFTEGKYG